MKDKIAEYHIGLVLKGTMWEINAKNRTLLTHIYLFAIFETVTSKNLNKKRKYYFAEEKQVHIAAD